MNKELKEPTNEKAPAMFSPISSQPPQKIIPTIIPPIIPPIIPMTEQELENYKLHRRFDRMGRLIGDQKMHKLMQSHVMVIGLGGVGSWAAESIARSGVGKMTLVDFDEICITNFNRQLHALNGLVGKQKSVVMAERLRGVNPGATVEAIPLFYNADNVEKIFSNKPDFVVDAIDHVTSKTHLIHYCRQNKIPMVSSTGSGGRMDPTQIKIADLALTTVDPLARAIRGILREKYDFPREGQGEFGIPAIYSTEAYLEPEELHYDGGKGFRCVCPQGDNPYFSCDRRNVVLGNASFVTGTFGLFCASIAINHLLGEAGPN